MSSSRKTFSQLKSCQLLKRVQCTTENNGKHHKKEARSLWPRECLHLWGKWSRCISSCIRKGPSSRLFEEWWISFGMRHGENIPKKIGGEGCAWAWAAWCFSACSQRRSPRSSSWYIRKAISSSCSLASTLSVRFKSLTRLLKNQHQFMSIQKETAQLESCDLANSSTLRAFSGDFWPRLSPCWEHFELPWDALKKSPSHFWCVIKILPFCCHPHLLPWPKGQKERDWISNRWVMILAFETIAVWKTWWNMRVEYALHNLQLSDLFPNLRRVKGFLGFKLICCGFHLESVPFL